MKANLSFYITLSFLATGIIDRIVFPVGSNEQHVLAIALPSVAIIILLISNLLGEDPILSSISIPRLPGSRAGGDQNLYQYLSELKGVLEEVKVNNQRLQMEINRLDVLVISLKKNNHYNQFITTVAGILGGWLVSGIPFPIH